MFLAICILLYTNSKDDLVLLVLSGLRCDAERHPHGRVEQYIQRSGIRRMRLYVQKWKRWLSLGLACRDTFTQPV